LQRLSNHNLTGQTGLDHQLRRKWQMQALVRLQGIAKLGRRDPVASAALDQWLDDLRRQYADRIIGFDGEIAETWGRMAAGRSMPIIDGLLAATALVRGMTLVTRNTCDIGGTGVAWLDPFNP
jgi:hypothetical protein